MVVRMRDLQQVLDEKQIELARVRQQIEALKFVAPLLAEQREPVEVPIDLPRGEPAQRNRWPLEVS